ncbi:MAG TPA: hypothetical protein VMA77_01035 [Solirubrobacteraceae bacterium]|nr:hypothetical protein [Solirubrobacteraceae bacterium]
MPDARVRELRDRVCLLEEALRQAQETVAFLHDCLIDPEHNFYAHPEGTEKHLEEWRALAPSPVGSSGHRGMRLTAM